MSGFEIDFSANNPITSNALNFAARINDVKKVRRLLRKLNPNCVDNRGWTCLHEAADKDSWESLMLILEHRDCRPLAETHEGHTALYLACRSECSLRTIEALLQKVSDVANYGSLEDVTPLHVASELGRVELIQLLLQYGADINVQDFDGDTPLHNAAMHGRSEAVTVLLHAGANISIRNKPLGFTAFHLACIRGDLDTFQAFLPFTNDFNEVSFAGDPALMLSLRGRNDNVVYYILDNGGNPNIRNEDGHTALDVALDINYSSVFKRLLEVTDHNLIHPDIICRACQPTWFSMEVLETLLSSDLGPEFFEFYDQCSIKYDFRFTDIALNSYLNVCDYVYDISPEKFREFFYLFLSKGVRVNARRPNEHPPLSHALLAVQKCFTEVFEILVQHGCDVDYCSTIVCQDYCTPDAFINAVSSDSGYAVQMMPYSLQCDPEYYLQYAQARRLSGLIPIEMITKLMKMISKDCELTAPEQLPYYLPPLKHLCRMKIRSTLRMAHGLMTTRQYLQCLYSLPVPNVIKNYIRFLECM